MVMLCAGEEWEPDDVSVRRTDSELMLSLDGGSRLVSGRTAAARRARGSGRYVSIKRRAGRTCSRRCESDTSLNDVTRQHDMPL